jgi:hypothetical protein
MNDRSVAGGRNHGVNVRVQVVGMNEKSERRWPAAQRLLQDRSGGKRRDWKQTFNVSVAKRC